MILATTFDVAGFLTRLFIDLVAVALFAWLMYLRRHRRRDLFLVYSIFNIGVFVVLAVIATRHISVGIGFGLFAILSIIRLRSEPFDNVELAYFFTALALAIVNGFEQDDYGVIVLLNAVVIVAIFFLDHPVFHTTTRSRRVMLDEVQTDAEALRAMLAERFGVEIVDLTINEIDYVRETTSITLRYVAEPLPR